MRRTLERLWLPAALVAICAWLAVAKTALGEYKIDAGTAVDALAHGDLSKYFSWHPVMGPVGTLFQAPWSLLASSELGRYQWAAFGCLLTLAALGWYLSAVAGRRGAGTVTRTTIAVVTVLNPITFECLANGHPEELLTTALALGAVVTACERRTIAAAALLGLAVATKQWAVIAIFPVLMVLPARRVVAAAIAAGIVVVLNLPYVIVDPGALMTTSQAVATGGHVAAPWSLWYTVHETLVLHLDGIEGVHAFRGVPVVAQPYTHLLIGALTVAVPLALWAWRRRWGISAVQAIALFALLSVLRCVLDPNDNIYYHFALLISLLAWDAIDPIGRVPLRGLAGLLAAILFWRWNLNPVAIPTFSAAYLAVMLGAAIVIGRALFRRPRSGTATAGMLGLKVTAAPSR